MNPVSKNLLVSCIAVFTLGACSSDNGPDVTPSPSLTRNEVAPANTPSDPLGEDLTTIRKTATEAIENKDTDGVRASAQKAIDKNIPDGSDGGPDKRTELIDKATDAARKKAKELGKEEDLDKVRSALDNYLKKES